LLLLFLLLLFLLLQVIALACRKMGPGTGALVQLAAQLTVSSSSSACSACLYC
jgi:hypothetical protein